MNWLQVYDPLGSITVSALVAAIPLYILFFMLAVKRAKGHFAAGLALVGALLVAVAVWGMPASLAASSFLYGAGVGIFPIVWIVVTAIWVYNMTVESGQFEIIKSSLATITEDRRLQAIFIAFAFGSFIEGTAGFGTPVAITAAMLVGLGFNPLYAAGLCLIANTAPVAFGALGIPIIAVAELTKLDVMHISAITGRQLPFLSIVVPLWLSVTMCGFKRSMEVLPACIVAGLCFAVTQFVTSNFVGPMLPDVLSAIATIVGLGLFLKVWQPKSIWRFPNEPASTGKAVCNYTQAEVIRAWMPWVILAAMVFIWGLKPVQDLMKSTVITFPWPGLDSLISKTVPVVAQDTVYKAVYKFNYLTSPGTAVLFAGILSLAVLPNFGVGRAVSCFGKTVVQLRFPILTIAMIVGLAYLMNYSGMSSTLGLAFAQTGSLFPLFSPIIGWLGVFLTGSDTSSNLLFGNLQMTTAQQIGVSPELCVAANSSGGVTGKMISPQSISVATAAANMVGQEGNLFLFSLKHSLAMITFVCVLTYLQAYPLSWMLP
ncbi:MAG: lactate permease LctP family transporter [Desulfomicrobiaceae bacterium]